MPLTPLEKWQELCREVHIEDVPGSIKQCKLALKNVHVNLVDLVNSRQTGRPVRVFPSKSALRAYTFEGREKKIFPRTEAKRDMFLKAFLKEME